MIAAAAAPWIRSYQRPPRGRAGAAGVGVSSTVPSTTGRVSGAVSTVRAAAASRVGPTGQRSRRTPSSSAIPTHSSRYASAPRAGPAHASSGAWARTTILVDGDSWRTSDTRLESHGFATLSCKTMASGWSCAATLATLTFGSGIGSNSNPASCMKNCTSERCRGIGTATRTRSVGSVPPARRGSSGDISVLLALSPVTEQGRWRPHPGGQSVYRSPLAVQERYVNCGTSLGDPQDARTAHPGHLPDGVSSGRYLSPGIPGTPARMSIPRDRHDVRS
jgi:hypothetical protein